MAVSLRNSQGFYLSVLNDEILIYFFIPEIAKENIEVIPEVCKNKFDLFEKFSHNQFLLFW